MANNYTNEEFQKTILMIVNSDKDGGFTSKELHEMFGTAKSKTKILSMKPDKIMETVKKHKWKFIKAGDVVEHITEGWIGVCTKTADNTSIFVLSANGIARRAFKQNCKVVGYMDISEFLSNIKNSINR